MKTLSLIFMASIALAFSASCTSTHTENSYKLAQQGMTTMEYAGFGMPQKELHAAVLQALYTKKWTVTDSGNPIKAYISHGQNAKLSVTVYDDRFVADTKGSNIDGKPYVPLNYLKHLVAQVRTNIIVEKSLGAGR